MKITVIGCGNGAFATAADLSARGHEITLYVQESHKKNFDAIRAIDYKDALIEAYTTAYNAVVNPTEGTILTVARESAEKAREVLHTTNDVNVKPIGSQRPLHQISDTVIEIQHDKHKEQVA